MSKTLIYVMIIITLSMDTLKGNLIFLVSVKTLWLGG